MGAVKADDFSGSPAGPGAQPQLRGWRLTVDRDAVGRPGHGSAQGPHAWSHMQSFHDLEVWRRAFALIKPIYRLTAAYPRDERFGLVSQTRDSVIAVAANIAEGSRRRTRGEFRNSLSVASGENAELECLLLVAVEVGFASLPEVRTLLVEVRAIARMLSALDNTLARRYAEKPDKARPRHSKPERSTPPTRPPND